MAEATTKVQARAIGTRILRLLSDILNSIADDFDLKADVADVKNYVRNIQPTSNGVNFLDGNGNVIYTLTNSSSVEKSDPQLSISPKTLTLTVNQSSDVTVTRLGDGVITATFIDGSDCATATVSDTTVTFTGTSGGTGTYQVSVAESANYTAASDTVTLAVNKISPNLTLDKYSLANNSTGDTVTANYVGDGTLSVSNPYYPYYNYTVNGNQIIFTRNKEKAGSLYTDTYVVTVTETADYETDTATVTVVVGAPSDVPVPTPTPDVE